MKNALAAGSCLLMLMGATLPVKSQKPATDRQPQPAGFVYCPSGILTHSIGNVGEQTEENLSLMAFWMKETEVSNAEYLEFLNDLKNTGETEKYLQCYPDTGLLHRELWPGYAVDYFTHPLFSDFPVTAITPHQANEYCNWLTKKYTAKYPAFSNAFFYIPNTAQWEYAARGGRKYNSFPWGIFTRNAKGCPLANYSDELNYPSPGGNSETLYQNYYFQWAFHNTLDTGFFNLQAQLKRKKRIVLWGLPVWADSYFPNDWGLYNMAGNVAEITGVYTTGTDSFFYTGGSFRTPARFMNLNWLLPHPVQAPAAASDVGFRPVMNYIPPRKRVAE